MQHLRLMQLVRLLQFVRRLRWRLLERLRQRLQQLWQWRPGRHSFPNSGPLCRSGPGCIVDNINTTDASYERAAFPTSPPARRTSLGS